MSGLSRCGRQYPYLLDAIKAAELRTFKTSRFFKAVNCDICTHWHVVEKQAVSRPDPFPPAIRNMLADRDDCCQRCGRFGRLEAHHRRAKASGGSSALPRGALNSEAQ